MEEKLHKWEETVRSKLKDFEADVRDDDWDLIASKLPPSGKTVFLATYRRYLAYAAAVVAGLMILGGVYFYLTNPPSDTVAVVDRPASSEVVKEPEAPVVAPTEDDVQPKAPVTGQVESAGLPQASVVAQTNDIVQPLTPIEQKSETAKPSSQPKVEKVAGVVSKPLQAKVTPPVASHQLRANHTVTVAPRTKPRRWGFGMGGSSYAVNSSSSAVVPVSLLSETYDDYISDRNDMPLRNESSVLINNEPEARSEVATDAPAANIKHKTPLSVGLGVSYYLNDRWALHSGLVYTLLRSGWSIENLDGYEVKNKQNLHYLGIPLSASYKIAEWRRVRFYAMAGGMVEYNVDGTLKKTTYSDNLKTITTEHIQMKKPFWSVNTRIGIDYPVWKMLHVYGEAGVSYYFDNHSDIETIRSEQPFDKSFQLGFRFGF